MLPNLKVEYVSTDTLAPYAGNAKEHPEWHVEQIAASIEQFGFDDPIGVWTNPQGVTEIVEGHGRVLAAKLLGMERVPIIRLDHLDDDARRAYTHVHNQTTMTTGFDLSVLEKEMASLPRFEWQDFGFKWDSMPADWFSNRQRNDGKQEGNDEYNEWLEKFEPKKTTDDCYTPDVVYDAVADWVAAEYGVDRSKFVRPFYPGGDYEHEDYPDGCVVVDNPPFSILTQIIRFYTAKGVRFFLFAPTLTLFAGRDLDVCYIAADCDITYENGAKVNTSFITNLDDENLVRTAPDLNAAVLKADEESRAEMAKPINLKYRYPPYVITAAMVSVWSNYGVDFRVPKGQGVQVGGLDAQKPVGKSIYGSGFLLSEQAKAQAEQAKAQAEQVKALEAAKALEADVEIDQRTGEVIWRLSEREMALIQSLG